MSTNINNSLQEKLQKALYLERYSQGHSKICPLAIPEIRSQIMRPSCKCKEAIDIKYIHCPNCEGARFISVTPNLKMECSECKGVGIVKETKKDE